MTTVAPDPLAQSLTEYAYRPVGPNGILRWDPRHDPIASAIDLTDYRRDRRRVHAAEILAEMRAALDALSRMELGPPTATDTTAHHNEPLAEGPGTSTDEGSALLDSRPEAAHG